MFGNIIAVFSLLPKVLAVVRLVEELLDPSVPSDRKKEVALDALRNAGVPENLVPIAGGLIDVVVGVLNALGVFRHKDGTDTDVSAQEVELSTTARAARDEPAVTDEVFEDFLKKTARKKN